MLQRIYKLVRRGDTRQSPYHFLQGIPSGLVAEEVSGEARRKDTPPEPEDPVRRRTSGRQRRASLEEYRETYLTIPKIRNRKTVFVSEDVRDELDAVVRREVVASSLRKGMRQKKPPDFWGP